MKTRKHRLLQRGLWLALLLVIGASTPEVIAKPNKGPRIAILVDGPNPGLEKLIERAKEELGNFGQAEPVQFPKTKVRVGDFTFKTARRHLEEALADPEVDVVWAFGLIASGAAVQKATSRRLKKPVLAPFVLESSSAALKKLDGGRSNLSYVIWTLALERDLQALRAVQPIRNVAYLMPKPLRDAIPSIESALAADAQKLGVRLHFVSEQDPAQLMQSLPSDIDAVYVALDPRHRPKDLDALADALIRRRLPSFSQMGRLGVEHGLLMGLGGPENAQRLARAVAVNTDAILQGEPPGKLNYVFQQVENLVVNVATAKKIGRPLSWAVISEAEMIGRESDTSARHVNLHDVVTEVRAQNLELRANKEDLEAAQQTVGESVGALLPALDGSLSGNWNDPDGATGASPERRLSWTGNASQVVVNEPAMARLTINKHLRDATRFDNRTAVLNTVQDASVGYLNVLSARATERIQRDNLKVTQTQLAQARLRQEVGRGSRSEIVRLETQLATNRRSVIDAVASRNVAEIELLRLLNRSSEEPFIPEDVSLESSQLMAAGERLQSYMTGPERFDVLRQFMAQEAIRNSPELKASESRLAAQRRQVLSNQLAPFVPEISVSGGVTHTFATGGAGTTEDAQAFFPLNPLSWQVGVTANLRLWEGNARYARIKREKAEARSLSLDLEARRIQIEASLRTTLHRAGASYAGIRLQRDAAAAADENLQLVQEAYARGKEDIITLVDAQNQALTADLSANTAVYDFLVDLLNVQRAMGRFDFWMSKAEVDDFFQRLKVFADLKETQS